jgi:hypothetical protein
MLLLILPLAPAPFSDHLASHDTTEPLDRLMCSPQKRAAMPEGPR